MSQHKLIFLQPSVGSYRYSFYRSLLEYTRSKYEIYVYCSLTDENKVRSVESLGDGIHYDNKLVCTALLSGKLFWQSIFRILKITNKKDILVINGNPRYLSNIFLALCVKFKGAKIIWWGHGWTAGGSKYNAKLRFFLMRYFDHVFLYTDCEVSKYRDLISKNVSVSGLNNGVDVNDIRSNAPEFNFLSKDNRICFIGRLEDKSRVDVMIQALSILNKKGLIKSGFCIEIIGDGSCANVYREMSVRLGVDHLISWNGAIWDSKTSNKILSSCSAFVYPGQVGLSVIHAFALGLPAIIHDNYELQMPEASVVIDGVNGLHFNYDDALSLAEKIHSMLSDKECLCRMSLNAYESVTSSFNTDDMAKRFSNHI